METKIGIHELSVSRKLYPNLKRHFYEKSNIG